MKLRITKRHVSAMCALAILAASSAGSSRAETQAGNEAAQRTESANSSKQAAASKDVERSPRDERPPVSPAEIAAWLADLDSREYKVRERATRQLMAAGPAALDPLLTAANGDRPEPAERAVWILQKLAKSDEVAAAMAALGRLTQLRDRPQIATQAETQLGRLSLQECQRRLIALGAECTLNVEVISLNPSGPVFHVRLGENWRGAAEDLRPLAELQYQQYIRLEGPAIDDRVVKMFEARPELARLELHNTKVSVAAVDSLKARHPDAVVYLKNRALMGVACRNHAAGAHVADVSSNTAAAAAGIVADDVITSIDGYKVPDFDRLTARVAQHEPGDKIEIQILRGEETRTVTVTLGSWTEYEGRPR